MVRTSGFHLVLGDENRSGIASVLPSGLVAAICVGDVPPDPMFPEEAARVASAVEGRRLEFARGRSCARRAMSQFDVGPQPILSDDNRAPVWPRPVVGSISHCEGYCCAVVGSSEAWGGIGIDIELLRPIEEGLQRLILTDPERRHLRRLDPAIPWPCVIFSIKEAIYKVWYPLMRCWLGFDQAVVSLDLERGRFEAELLTELPGHSPAWPHRVEGRFCIEGPYVMAAVSLSLEH